MVVDVVLPALFGREERSKRLPHLSVCLRLGLLVLLLLMRPRHASSPIRPHHCFLESGIANEFEQNNGDGIGIEAVVLAVVVVVNVRVDFRCRRCHRRGCHRFQLPPTSCHSAATPASPPARVATPQQQQQRLNSAPQHPIDQYSSGERW